MGLKHTRYKDVTVLKEVRLEHCTLYFRDDGILRVVLHAQQVITMEDARAAVAYMKEHHPEDQFLNLFVAEEDADVNDEVRSWAASPENNQFTIADAVVIQSFPQKIVANFYLKFNKPVKPTKVFTDENKAIAWLLSQKKLLS